MYTQNSYTGKETFITFNGVETMQFVTLKENCDTQLLLTGFFKNKVSKKLKKTQIRFFFSKIKRI